VLHELFAPIRANYHHLTAVHDGTGTIEFRVMPGADAIQPQIALRTRSIEGRRTKSEGPAYIAFLFFAMCAGFDSALRALTFLSQKAKKN